MIFKSKKTATLIGFLKEKYIFISLVSFLIIAFNSNGFGTNTSVSNQPSLSEIENLGSSIITNNLNLPFDNNEGLIIEEIEDRHKVSFKPALVYQLKVENFNYNKGYTKKKQVTPEVKSVPNYIKYCTLNYYS